MGRGVSYGGGQSSLGYLFGGGETSRPTKGNTEAPKSAPAVNDDASTKPTSPPSEAPKSAPVVNNDASTKPTSPPPSATKSVSRDIPAGIKGLSGNNYARVDGQNCGNFITDRPSTKVHAAPGGGSSLGYLFGGDNN